MNEMWREVNSAMNEMWREMRSHWRQYKHERQRADVVVERARGEVHHQQLELFRKTYGDSRADLACIGLTRIFSLEEIRSVTVQDFLTAPRPTAKEVSREDVALICITYVHDPKSISGRPLDRMTPLTFSMMLYGVLQWCKRQQRVHFRLWNDITNSSGKSNCESLSWVGGGIIPYLLFDHVCIEYQPGVGFEDRLWPIIECKLASNTKGTTFIFRDEDHPDADENGIVIRERVLATTSRSKNVQDALQTVANWALSGPIFSLPTYWDSDRQALACMFGRILKSKLFTDMVNAASEDPKIDPTNLIITTVKEYETVRKNCSYGPSQEWAEKWAPEGLKDITKRFRRHAIIDGPRYSFTGSGQVWRADVSFIPSCFEYTPLNEHTATVNEKNARQHTRAHIFQTASGRTYALLKNDNMFWKKRAAVWVQFETPGSDFTTVRVSSYTRIVTDTDSHERAIIFGLAGERLYPKASVLGKDFHWTGKV